MGLTAEAQGFLLDRKKENIEPWRSSCDGCKGSLKKLFWSPVFSAGLNCIQAFHLCVGWRKRFLFANPVLERMLQIDNIVKTEALPELED